MKKDYRIVSLLIAVLVTLMLVSCEPKSEFSEEWSSYRGSNRDGISETKIPIKVWTKEDPLKLVWKHKFGDGFSGIIIDGKNLITAFAEDSSEVVGAFDRVTGNPIWKTKIGKVFVEEFGNGPRATPVIDNGKVYAYNSWGHLYSLDSKTGNIIWQYEISDSNQVAMPQFGHSTTPIVIGEKLIIHSGDMKNNSAFMAFDKNTGKVLWEKGNSVVSYSSPIYAKIENQNQLIFAITRPGEVDGKKVWVKEVVGYTPDGDKLWTGPSLSGVIAMPVFIKPNKIFVSGSNAGDCYLLEIKKTGNEFMADTVWFSTEMQNHFNSSVYHNGYIYGYSNATFHCLDAKTGKRLWRKRGLGKGSVIVADNKLIILTDRGKLVLAEATPEKYKELASENVIEGLTWTSPTLADGKLYLRSREEIACYDLTK